MAAEAFLALTLGEVFSRLPLNDYKGAVLLITHDAHLAAAVADRLWLVKDRQAKHYDGDLDDYRALILDANKTQAKGTRGKREKTSPSVKARKASAAIREALAPLKKIARQKEARIDELNAILARLDKALGEPGLFENNLARATKLQKERAALVNAISNAEEAWVDALETYEDAKSS